MRHPRPRAHALNIAGVDDRPIAHAVLVLECTVEHVTDDLHVVVAMGREPAVRCDRVIVDHAQIRKPGKPGIVVAAE